MERCKAIIDMLAIRPDGFWFMDPVSEADVPDYGAAAGRRIAVHLLEDRAPPSARLVAPRAQAAPTSRGAPPEQLGGSPRPQ